MQMVPLGDSAVIIQFGSQISLDIHRMVNACAARLEKEPFPGMVEIVPAFTTVTVYYDPLQLSFREVCSALEPIVTDLDDIKTNTPRIVEIPVCYGGEFGPDLLFVAEHNGLTAEEVIQIHSSGEYLVYMIGFAPGFPYLGGMSERIGAPRRQVPRLSIPAGTVGIAGMQTGVYPIETPGGWQMIGRTPVPLFRPTHSTPSLLQSGDIVHFHPISQKEFQEWKEDAQ
jgi:inhibitor of KinA